MNAVNLREITEVLNDKTDRNLLNVDTTSGADAVIEYMTPTAQNGYTWYRKYKSGWVEQGGFVAANAGSTACLITLSIEMSSNVYSAIGQVTESYTGTSSGGINFYDFTATSMKLNKNNTNRAVWWEVKGMAA